MLNQEFCFGQIKFELSVSHLRGDAAGAVEYAHLELWRGARAGDWRFKVTSKPSAEFSLAGHGFQPGVMAL